MELARGSVTDRLWGRTLAALAQRALTGQLTVITDGKRYQIAFSDGTVVAAVSPLAGDAAVRIALTAGLISSTQVSDIARRQTASPGRDEIEVLAEAARLGPDHALRLRRRTIAQRAARTFSLDRGEFFVEDQITLPIVDGTALDIRTVVYLGAKGNLSEARLGHDLSTLGTWFQLHPGAAEDLPLFGFTADDQPALQLVARGASLSELESTVIDPRSVHAVIYALVSCGAVDAAAMPPPPAGLDEPTYRKPPEPDTLRQQQTHRIPRAQSEPTTHRGADDAGRTRGVSGAEGRRGEIDSPTIQRPRSASRPPPPTKNRANDAQASDILSLIGERLKLLDERTDHFKLLGVTPDVDANGLRKAYFSLAKQLHPDRLASLGIVDENRTAQRLFAEVNASFAVLNDPTRRAEYTSIMRRGGAAVVRAEEARAEALAERVIESEEAFRRGELALKRDQMGTAIAELTRAIELNPDEADYHSTLAWAHFCAAPDKVAIAAKTRTDLGRAIQRSPRAILGRFYLGRVERMLGKDAEALRIFQEVVQAAPNHAEAKAEIRVLEQRLAKKR